MSTVFDYRKRRLGLLINPVNTEDVTRPAVNDERDERLAPRRSHGCWMPARTRAIPGCSLLSSLALKPAAGAAAC